MNNQPAIPRRAAVRLGLICDTHMPQRWPDLPPGAAEVFRDVDLILHAGDLGELWALDRLGAIAPVIAVHGNDETAEAQRELPYQQLIALGGRRLLLCHSHLLDHAAEMASRIDDDWRPKLLQRARQAQRAGASIYVLGHLHIPFAVEVEGVLLVNPGAIASGHPFTRQTRQTVAVLELGASGVGVTHFDLADPARPVEATVDSDAGFAAAAAVYSATILAGDLKPHAADLWKAQASMPASSRALPKDRRPCWNRAIASSRRMSSSVMRAARRMSDGISSVVIYITIPVNPAVRKSWDVDHAAAAYSASILAGDPKPRAQDLLALLRSHPVVAAAGA